MSDKRKSSILDALSFRGFRYFLLGAFVSSIGTWLQVAALMWLVEQYKVSNDTLVAVINMASWMPVLLFGLFSGAISDRLDRRRTILISQFIMMGCSLAIAVTATCKFVNIGMIIALITISGTAYAFFVIAWVALQPVLVDKESILDAVALNNGQFNLARFVGPLLAGALLVWWVPSAFYLNAVTFLAFIALIYAAGVKTEPPRAGGGASRSHPLTEVAEGLRYVAGTGWMLKVLIAMSLISFFGFSFIVLMPAVSRQLLHIQAVRYGLLFGMTGLGAVVGMPSLAFLHRHVHYDNILRISATLATGMLVCFSLSGIYWVSCLLAFLLGADFLVFIGAVNGMLVKHARQDMVGRVSSMWVVGFIGIYPLGGLLLGIITDIWKVEIALLVGAAGCGLVTVWLLLSPIMKKAEEAISESEQGAA